MFYIFIYNFMLYIYGSISDAKQILQFRQNILS